MKKALVFLPIVTTMIFLSMAQAGEIRVALSGEDATAPRTRRGTLSSAARIPGACPVRGSFQPAASVRPDGCAPSSGALYNANVGYGW